MTICDASFEQCLATHPDEAYEMLAEVSPHCRSAERIRDALSAESPVNDVHTHTEGDPR